LLRAGNENQRHYIYSTENGCSATHTVEKPLDVTFEDVGYLLRRAADSQQTGTYRTGAASGEALDVP